MNIARQHGFSHKNDRQARPGKTHTHTHTHTHKTINILSLLFCFLLLNTQSVKRSWTATGLNCEGEKEEEEEEHKKTHKSLSDTSALVGTNLCFLTALSMFWERDRLRERERDGDGDRGGQREAICILSRALGVRGDRIHCTSPGGHREVTGRGLNGSGQEISLGAKRKRKRWKKKREEK